MANRIAAKRTSPAALLLSPSKKDCTTLEGEENPTMKGESLSIVVTNTFATPKKYTAS